MNWKRCPTCGIWVIDGLHECTQTVGIMADTTVEFVTCPNCGNLYNPQLAHTCRVDWQYDAYASALWLMNDEAIIILRRIADALEKIMEKL